MRDQPSQYDHDDKAIDGLIAQYMMRLDDGEQLSPETFIDEHPKHRDALQRYFADLDGINDVLNEEPRSDRGHDLGRPTCGTLLSGFEQPHSQERLEQIGDYVILETLGRGGMGTVYKAWQPSLGRIVALKTILQSGDVTEKQVRRFLSEAESMATLDHAGIVRIYDVGESGGLHYFTMAFVDGESLADRLRESPLPPRQAAELIAKTAEIIEFAHDRGVVHRDLKPSNILLDKEGRPHVSDFGLAKRAYAEEGLTMTGQVLGTPAFMPPEQARGDTEVNQAADIYALGAVLFMSLTGRAPFQAATPIETLRQVIDEEPPSLRTLNHNLPPDLETICRKCLEKEPTARYESALQFAADLRRWLYGEPITARRARTAERAAKWARRRPAIAALMGMLVLTMSIGTLVSVYFAFDARRQARAANAARTDAINKKNEAEAVVTFFVDNILAAGRPVGQEGGLGIGVTLKESVDTAEPRVSAAFQGQPLAEASIRRALGRSYFYLGDEFLAIDQLEHARRLYSTTMGVSDETKFSLMRDLASAYHYAGRLTDATRLLVQTLEAQQQKLGPLHAETLRTTSALAFCYITCGREHEATELLKVNLETQTKTLGAHHADTLRSAHTLSYAYFLVGQKEECLQLIEEVFDARKRTIGKEHPETIGAMHTFGCFIPSLRLNDAIEILEEALAISKRQLGQEHRQTLSIASNLGLRYSWGGRRKDAIKLLEKTLATESAKFGRDHDSTLLTQHHLASSYSDEKGIAEFEELLKIRDKKFPHDHFHTWWVTFLLAKRLMNVNRVDDAIAIYERSVDTRRVDHPWTNISRRNLANAYRLKSRIVDALELEKLIYANEVHAKRQKKEPTSLAESLARYGYTLIKLKQDAEAARVCRECYEIYRIETPDSWQFYVAQCLLGQAYADQNQNSAAEQHLIPGFEGLSQHVADVPEEYEFLTVETIERIVDFYQTRQNTERLSRWNKTLGDHRAAADKAKMLRKRALQHATEGKLLEAITLHEQVAGLMGQRPNHQSLRDLYARALQWEQAVNANERLQRGTRNWQQLALLFMLDRDDDYLQARKALEDDFDTQAEVIWRSGYLDESVISTYHIPEHLFAMLLRPLEDHQIEKTRRLGELIANSDSSHHQRLAGMAMYRVGVFRDWYASLPTASPLRDQNQMLVSITEFQAEPSEENRAKLVAKTVDEEELLETQMKEGFLGASWEEHIERVCRIREARSVLSVHVPR